MELKSPLDGREMALPVDVKAKKGKRRSPLAAISAPCPVCQQSSLIPDWARALRPDRRQAKHWRFTYRGIL
jgi:hypothetical protein